MANRIIKFRAWNKESEEFIYAEPVYGFFPSLTMEGEMKGMAGTPIYGEIQQFTGLKDKNGVEIYEGDIVKFDFIDYAKDDIEKDYDIKLKQIINDKSKVYWCVGGWWAIELWVGGSAPLQHAFGNHHMNDTNIVVIGNIHENKELTKQNEQ